MPLLMPSERLAGGTRFKFAVLPVCYDLSRERTSRDEASRARLARLHVVEHIFHVLALWEMALGKRNINWFKKIMVNMNSCLILLVLDGLLAGWLRCPFSGTCGHGANRPIVVGSSGVLQDLHLQSQLVAAFLCDWHQPASAEDTLDSHSCCSASNVL